MPTFKDDCSLEMRLIFHVKSYIHKSYTLNGIFQLQLTITFPFQESEESGGRGFCGDLLCGESQGQCRSEEFGSDAGARNWGSVLVFRSWFQKKMSPSLRSTNIISTWQWNIQHDTTYILAIDKVISSQLWQKFQWVQ